MAYQLKLDEMLDALCNCGHPRAAELTALVENTADTLAEALATHLGIKWDVASFQGMAFAGTCVPFYPVHEGQPLPPEIADYDQEEEWAC